jgi:hypothetical protein
MPIAPSFLTRGMEPQSRALPAIATIAAGSVAVQFAAPLALSPAVQNFVLSSGFTAFALVGGVLAAISPVLAVALILRSPRPSGREEPEGGE